MRIPAALGSRSSKRHLLNTGSFPGYGGTGTWHAVGILVNLSAGVQIRYNYIDKTGYAGVLLGSDSNFVYCNIIKNAMFTLNDGGAIYTDCNRSFIRNNIIYDTKGDLTSSGPWYPLGQGIWLEFLGDYRRSVVANNTVVRSGCNGLYLPNNFSDTIVSNVLYDNAVAQLDLDGQLTNSSTGRTQNVPQANSIRDNVCYATARSEMALEFRPEYNYGVLAGNYVCDPYTDSVVSGYGTGNAYYTQYNYTLAQWRSLYPAWADLTAGTDPIKRPSAMSANNPCGLGAIIINETASQKTFPLGPGSWVDLDDKPVSGSLSVPPYSSQIVVRSDSTLGISSPVASFAGFSFGQHGAVIDYVLPEKSDVSLVVYTVSGRFVYRSSIATQKSGEHTQDLGKESDGKNKIGQGIYTFVLNATSAKKSWMEKGKFIVLR